MVFAYFFKNKSQTEKIIAVSKVLHILLMIIGVITTILGLMKIFVYVWPVLGLSSETLMIGDVFVALPNLLHIEGTNLFYWPMSGMGAFGFGLEGVLRTIALVVSLFMAERMFRQLKHGASPFSAVVVSWFKRFAYALFLLYFATGVVNIIVPLILLAIVHVFEYGCILQEESDRTL